MIKYVIITLAIVFAAVIIPARAIYCQDENLRMIDGSVVSVDPQNSQIVVKTAEIFTFNVASDAKITNKDGFDIRLSDISAGNYVTVGYYNDQSGAHIARNINVEYNR